VVAGRTADADLRQQYEHFGDETRDHVERLEQLIVASGGDAQYVSPSARATERAAAGLLESTFLLEGSLDPVTADLAMLEAVMLAEAKDRETHTVDPLSRMHVMTIVAAEQQTMNFYMNHGTDSVEPIARGRYAEIALIEEQHVTHYESLLDPLDSWLKQLVFHEYHEACLYWSMPQNEEDRQIASIWELHLEMEIGQLQAACDLLRRYEGIEPEELLPKELPDTPVTFEPNKDYVREILASQIDLRADGIDYVPDDALPPTHRSRRYRDVVNAADVPSETVIDQNRACIRRDFRDETEGPNPVVELRASE
jgi:hypothetical protein